MVQQVLPLSQFTIHNSSVIAVSDAVLQEFLFGGFFPKDHETRKHGFQFLSSHLFCLTSVSWLKMVSLCLDA